MEESEQMRESEEYLVCVLLLDALLLLLCSAVTETDPGSSCGSRSRSGGVGVGVSVRRGGGRRVWLLGCERERATVSEIGKSRSVRRTEESTREESPGEKRTQEKLKPKEHTRRREEEGRGSSKQ